MTTSTGRPRNEGGIRRHFSPLIARLNARDPAHELAKQIERKLATSSRFVTTVFVLTELLATFSQWGSFSRGLAHRAARATLASPNFTVVPATRALLLDGLSEYEARPDKNYSFVDCASMVVMEQRKITDVLTNDHGFQQAGFSLLP